MKLNLIYIKDLDSRIIKKNTRYICIFNLFLSNCVQSSINNLSIPSIQSLYFNYPFWFGAKPFPCGIPFLKFP